MAADDALVISGERIRSRLIAGTGRFRSEQDMEAALRASGADMVTLAVKRLDLEAPEGGRFMEILERGGYRLLPNTAGCATAEEAVFAAQLAREMLDTNWIKLEVIPDARYLLPDAAETLAAAETLVADGFVVLPYIGADPVAARRLEEAGCATVMPLGSPIGSGRGLLTAEEIGMIVEGAGVPVVVDAGIGVPSEAAQALEMGADAVLVNSAIAGARDPAQMAAAFRQGVEAGRAARLAGRMARRSGAVPSSPVDDAPRPPGRG